ncbi:hypothetical protein BWI17_14535 [Betaproteobacteria bacterium GR16-43]|nr:hypothetical protein BWI17_14535 [Betaproteobacteria bacterium GR16-43]
MPPRGAAPAPVDSLEALLAREDAAFVRAAYQLLLGREVDPEGLGNYLEQLADGLARTDFLASLALSREGRRRAVAGAGNDPEAALRDRVHAFAAPSARSLDALLAYHDAAFVSCAYFALLGRDADAQGAGEYLRQLREGASKWSVLGSLRASREYADREAARHAIARGQPGPFANTASPAVRSDAKFALAVHLLLTGRKPGPVALAAEVARLHAGLAREAFVAGIAASDAARESRELLAQLESTLRRQRLARLPIVGRWLAALLGLEGESRAEKRLRRIENELHLLVAGPGRTAPRAPAPPSIEEPAANDPDVVLRPHLVLAPRLATLGSTVDRRQEAAR